jgi:D-glycero-D-manno-heptose 1,7-bisphosphate phosphatase
MNLQKAIFLDRDGVLNKDQGKYTYKLEEFELIEGVPEALKLLKEQGYKLIVITNQAGISKGLYSIEQMNLCHNKLHSITNSIIDAIYFSPYHPDQTNSLSRKPGSLMFERAIAKFNIDPSSSWMVGDKERDLIPAKKFQIKTILVGGEEKSGFADIEAKNLKEAAKIIISLSNGL